MSIILEIRVTVLNRSCLREKIQHKFHKQVKQYQFEYKYKSKSKNSIRNDEVHAHTSLQTVRVGSDLLIKLGPRS